MYSYTLQYMRIELLFIPKYSEETREREQHQNWQHSQNIQCE